jgi:hypothetical protein
MNADKDVKSNLALAESATLDSEGLHHDDTNLSDAGWEVLEDTPVHVLYQKSSVLRLRASHDEVNKHRLKWEMGVHVNGTQIGYAAITLRPGDMNGSTVGLLINNAITEAEAEFNRWSDALAEARRVVQA